MTSAYAFADSLEKEIENRETTLINSRFNVEELIDRIVFKGSDNQEVINFNKGFTASFREKFKYGNILLQDFGEQEVYYTFIDSYVNQQTKKVHAVFRLFSPEGGLNYHDYELNFNDSLNHWEILDVYPYLSGELFSKTFRSIYMPIILPMLNNNGEIPTNQVKTILKIKKIKELSEAGNHVLAYKMCDSIPEAFQSKKYFRLLVLQIAENMSDEKYMEEGGKILSLFPDDPSTNLVAIDYYSAIGDFDKALQMVEKLDKQVGGDELLDYYRGLVFHQKEDLDKASEYYLKFLGNYPYCQDAYDIGIDLYVEQKEFENAVNVIDTMVTENEYDKNAMVDNIKEIYPKLAKNAKFKAWAKK
jgi:hypothetical protein